MTQEHDDEQEDGGASAHDRKARTRARGRAQAAAPMVQPNGCPGCARTGRREVAEHDREGETCNVYQTFCGCPLGVHLQATRGGEYFYQVRDAIQSRFRIAIVDPTPAQCKPGGAIRRAIPKLGEFVPTAAFQLLPRPAEEYVPEIARVGYRFVVPPLTIAEARAKLGWPAEGSGPPPAAAPDPDRVPRTAHLLPLEGDALAAHRARLAKPLRPDPSSFVRIGVDEQRPLDLGASAPDQASADRRELAPGGVPDDAPPPWLQDDDAQPPWLR